MEGGSRLTRLHSPRRGCIAEYQDVFDILIAHVVPPVRWVGLEDIVLAGCIKRDDIVGESVGIFYGTVIADGQGPIIVRALKHSPNTKGMRINCKEFC